MLKQEITEDLKNSIFRGVFRPGQIRASLPEHRKILKANKEIKLLKVESLIRDHHLQSKNRLIKHLNRSL
jgi:DNA-binding GntR family transcriptional regulator